MLGQNHHFNRYAPEKIPYAITRYVNETRRLYGVLDKRLTGRAFIAGDDYSIADMAAYPWIVPHERQEMDLADFPQLKAWFERIGARAATRRAYAIADTIEGKVDLASDEEARRHMFGQGAKAG
jgi:GST-like protein